MARNNRIGPYIDYRAGENRTGLHRITYEDHRLDPQLLFDIGRDLDKFVGGSAHGYGSPIISEFKEVVFGYRRPLDDVIHKSWLYTDVDFWRSHHARWMPSYPHRVCVNAHITTHDNLSVTLSARCLSTRGMWEPAEEWSSDPFWSFGGFRERPINEALFLRDVSALFHDTVDLRGKDAKSRSVQCKAVLASFWLTMERLSPFFEPHFGNYIAGLTERPVTWTNPDQPLVGLEIVDGLGEYREWLQQELDSFEERAGYTAEAFYDICEESRRGLGFEKTSKAIRHSSRGSIDLVPSAIYNLFKFLNTAKDYGIWKPGILRSELRTKLVSWAERYGIDPQIAVGIWRGSSDQGLTSAQKADNLRRQHGAHIEIDVREFERELDQIGSVMAKLGIEPAAAVPAPPYSSVPSRIPGRVSRIASTGKTATPIRTRTKPQNEVDGDVAASGKTTSPLSPPDYPDRAFDPGSEDLADLGVADARELVKLMNDRLTAVGRFPITAGDYPTTKAKFAKLAKRWKQMNPDGKQ